MITRLPEAGEGKVITITVSKKLLPYLTEWFQDTKQDGETPEDFVLRLMKEQTKEYYINREVFQTVKTLEDQKETDLEALGADVELLTNEID